MAHISQEKNFLYALENDMDLHCYSASLIFDLDYNDFFYFGEEGKKQALEDDDRLKAESLVLGDEGIVLDVDDSGEAVKRPDMKKKYRTPAKSITFGLIYGMGPGRLADTLEISYKEAKSLINKYFKVFPTIKKTLDKFVEMAMENKYAYSPLDGRRRIFSGVDWDHSGKVSHLQNVAKNMPFQGAGASVTKLALCWMKREIDKMGWDAMMILTVHDELEIECHKDEAEVVAKRLEEIMVKAFHHYAPGVPMKASAKVADCWVH